MMKDYLHLESTKTSVHQNSCEFEDFKMFVMLGLSESIVGIGRIYIICQKLSKETTSWSNVIRNMEDRLLQITDSTSKNK